MEALILIGLVAAIAAIVFGQTEINKKNAELGITAKAKGITVYEDGTAEVAATLGGAAAVRAPILDVEWFDGRMRKSVAGRSLAAAATGGLSLLASNNAGEATLTISTEAWTRTVSAKQEIELRVLRDTATAAKFRTARTS